jgi:flavin-binding protein dodecin
MTTGTQVATRVAKIIELVGESPRSWDEAAQRAVEEAGKTVHNITGLEVTNWTATVDNGRIASYRVDVKLAFAVDPSRS